MTTAFTTDRLLIRRWHPLQDAHDALEIYGDPEVVCWLSDQHPLTNLFAAQQKLQRYVDRFEAKDSRIGCWAVVEPHLESVIGNVLLIPLPDRNYQATENYEIGWHFRQSSWGNGYATEAAEAILNYGLETLGLPGIYAVTLPDNVRSISVMQRLAMCFLGKTQNYYGGRELLLFRKSVVIHR